MHTERQWVIYFDAEAPVFVDFFVYSYYDVEEMNLNSAL